MNELSTAVLIGFAFFGMLGYIYWHTKMRDRSAWYIANYLSRNGIDPKQYAVFKRKDIVTPGGAQIWSTTENIPAEFLARVDTEIARLVRNHTRAQPGWTNHLKISDYKICLIDPMTTNVETTPGSPAIFVQGYQSAGTVIGTHPSSNIKGGPRLVIPHQADRGWQYLDYFGASVYNEGEHCIEAVNDYGIFLTYANAGDVHPHVGDELSPVGLHIQVPVEAPCKVNIEAA